MSDRTTINVPKGVHTDAGKVKDRHDETWADVLRFYANHRGSVSNGGLGQPGQPMQDIDTLSYDDVEQACKAAIRAELPIEQMGGGY